MSAWDFVALAYGLTAIGTVALTLLSWRAMRHAEAAADAAKPRR